jgi:hypothetical protein
MIEVMTPSIAVIGDGALERSICLLADHEGLRCSSFSTFEQFRSQLADIASIVLLVKGEERSSPATALGLLRLDLEFKGRIMITSFAPQRVTVGQEMSGLLKTAGCFYLRPPFLVEDFRKMVAPERSLSDEQMDHVRDVILTYKIVQMARLLNHTYTNKFALTLAHLRELEKLSYYSQPPFNRVMSELRAARDHLDRYKLQTFRSDIEKLLRLTHESKRKQSVNRTSMGTQWDSIDAWLDLSERVSDEMESMVSEIFNQSKQAQRAIRDIFEALTRWEEKASIGTK